MDSQCPTFSKLTSVLFILAKRDFYVTFG